MIIHKPPTYKKKRNNKAKKKQTVEEEGGRGRALCLESRGTTALDREYQYDGH